MNDTFYMNSSNTLPFGRALQTF